MDNPGRGAGSARQVGAELSAFIPERPVHRERGPRFRLWPGSLPFPSTLPHHSALPAPSELALEPDVVSIGAQQLDHARNQRPPTEPASVATPSVSGSQAGRADLRLTGSGRDAIAAALEGLPSDGEVWISSSVETSLRRLSPCVAEAVARQARFADRPGARTVAVVFVHEWGIPHRDRSAILRLAAERDWRVVDDCAHAFSYGLELAAAGGTVAFSLPKFFPIPRGGILARPRTQGCSGNECTSAANLVRLVPSRSSAHLANWRRLDALARAAGFSAVDDLADGIIPQVYRLKVRRQFAAQALFAEAGVETTPPFYAGWLALPCHADLNEAYWVDAERVFEQLRSRF